MKSILAILLLSNSLAFAQTTPATTTLNSSEVIGAVRALLAVPQEAAIFSDGMELRAITVTEQNALVTVYTFSGKRRALGSKSPRFLQIEENRTLVPALTVTYIPKLIN